LRAALATRGFNITTSQSLELIAEAFGVAGWNTLAAAIRQEAPTGRDSTSRPQQATAGWASSPSFSAVLRLKMRQTPFFMRSSAGAEPPGLAHVRLSSIPRGARRKLRNVSWSLEE
jgi:hypothetical protein